MEIECHSRVALRRRHQVEAEVQDQQALRLLVVGELLRLIRNRHPRLL